MYISALLTIPRRNIYSRWKTIETQCSNVQHARNCLFTKQVLHVTRKQCMVIRKKAVRNPQTQRWDTILDTFESTVLRTVIAHITYKAIIYLSTFFFIPFLDYLSNDCTTVHISRYALEILKQLYMKLMSYQRKNRKFMEVKHTNMQLVN